MLVRDELEYIAAYINEIEDKRHEPTLEMVLDAINRVGLGYKLELDGFGGVIVEEVPIE